MTPFLILATPRARASVLVSALDATPGVRCAAESPGFLAGLMDFHGLREKTAAAAAASPWLALAAPPAEWESSLRGILPAWAGADESHTHCGLRETFLGREGWEQAVGAWSWIQTLWPQARLIFITRDMEETEISLHATLPLWVPSYGTCHGDCLRRIRGVRQSMADYHAMNPRSTLMLDSAELLDFDLLSAKLGRLGIPLGRDAWQEAVSTVRGDWKSLGSLVPKGNKTSNDPSPPSPRRDFRLPLVTRPAPPDLAVYALRYGSEPWLEECVPTLESWARRHHLPLKVRTEPDPRYPSPKFAVLDMLRDFLESPARHMMYIDSDVFIHPAAPVPKLDLPGIHIAADRVYPGNETWPRWCRRHFGRKPRGWTYRNAGVWALDRAAAEAILAVAAPPYLERVQEQHQFNWWLYLAAEQGMPVQDLSPVFNMFPGRKRRAWFYHLAGREKLAKLARIRERGHLPLPPEPPAETPQPELDLAIVYPWKAEAAAWEELRYSLRSVERHFSDKTCPIFILGPERPHWLLAQDRVRFLRADSYLDALQAGLRLAKRVVWMNDDIQLLRDLSPRDLEAALYTGDALPKASDWFGHSNLWRRGFSRAVIDLRHHGAEDVLDFSTHTPYLFEHGKAMETLAKFHLGRKPVFETLYHNHHRSPAVEIGRRKCRDMLCPHAWYLNFSDKTLTPELKSRIRARFPQPAPWEDPADLSPPGTLEIVVMGHASAGFPHLAALRAANPGTPVHTSAGEDGEEDRRVEAWRNCDRHIRAWWLANRHNVNSSHVAFVEWDVLANSPLDPLVDPDAGLLGRDLKEPGDPWAWWGELARLPASLALHACGIAPLAVLVARRDCLDAIAAPEWDDLFAADIFCEVRLPTLARACGFAVRGSSALPGTGVTPIPHPGSLPGIWHPVKEGGEMKSE